MSLPIDLIGKTNTMEPSIAGTEMERPKDNQSRERALTIIGFF